MTSDRPKRRLGFAATLLLAGGAAAWWWTTRDAGVPRIEPVAPRERAERNVAAPPIAPEVERSTDAAPPPPVDASLPATVAAASPLLMPDRVVVVTGVVLAAGDGTPIEGAELLVRGESSFITGDGRLGDEIGEADTDEQGRYEVRIEGGVPAWLRVEARAEGASFDAVVLAVERDATALRADFRLRKSLEAAVEVVRASDGSPIPFASVELRDEERAGWSRDGETDAAGRWSESGVDDLPRHGLAVVVKAEGFAPRRFAPLEVPDHGDRLVLRCELAPPRPLTGVVVAEGGEPIVDAHVELFPLHDAFENCGDEASTDEAGRFTLDAGGVPEALAALLVSADEWQSVGIERPWSGGGEVTIVMSKPDPPWRGRVIDRATGHGVAGCAFIAELLSVPFSGPDIGQFAQSEEDGSFEAHLRCMPRGTAVRVQLWADGYAEVAFDLATASDGRIAGPSLIELERMLVIQGRVVDASGTADLRGATVLAYLDRTSGAAIDGVGAAEEFASLQSRVSRKDASYELELPLSLARAAGRCSIVVEHNRGRFALGRLDLTAQLDRSAPGEPVILTLDLPIDTRPWWVREGR